jgi:hypothetical protein
MLILLHAGHSVGIVYGLGRQVGRYTSLSCYKLLVIADCMDVRTQKNSGVQHAALVHHCSVSDVDGHEVMIFILLEQQYV